MDFDNTVEKTIGYGRCQIASEGFMFAWFFTFDKSCKMSNEGKLTFHSLLRGLWLSKKKKSSPVQTINVINEKLLFLKLNVSTLSCVY